MVQKIFTEQLTGKTLTLESANGTPVVLSAANTGSLVSGGVEVGSGGGSSTTTYADMAALVAATDMSDGDMAFVLATNNLYIYKTNGWFKIATVENLQPGSISGVDASYALAANGAPTVITATATDPEGFPLTWSYAVTTGSLANTATVSQVNNVFTITPSTAESDEGDFSITFSVTDGVNGAVNTVSDFTLSFGWTVDLSNITYDSVSYITVQSSGPVGFDMSADGTKVIICRFGDNIIYQYNLSIPYDISTMSYSNISVSLSEVSTQAVDVTFSPDGSKLYATSNGSKFYHQYTLSTPYDISTRSYDSVSLGIGSSLLYDLKFNSDGTKAFIFNSSDDKVYEYSLSTPYSLSGANLINTTAAFTDGLGPLGILFSQNGEKMYISGTDNTTATIHQYTLANPFDTSSFTYDNVSFDMSSQAPVMRDIIFHPDGTKMYVLDYTNSAIYQYSTGL